MEPIDLTIAKPLNLMVQKPKRATPKRLKTFPEVLTETGRFRCQYCAGTFTLSTNLRKHERNLHADVLATRFANAATFCHGCQSQFFTRRSLNYHLSQSRTCQSAIVLNNIPLTGDSKTDASEPSDASDDDDDISAPQPPPPSQQMEDPNSVEAVLGATTSFACQYCPAVFKMNSKMRKHQRLCHAEKLTELPFQCTGCSKRFSNKRAITQHLRWSMVCAAITTTAGKTLASGRTTAVGAESSTQLMTPSTSEEAMVMEVNKAEDENH